MSQTRLTRRSCVLLTDARLSYYFVNDYHISILPDYRISHVNAVVFLSLCSQTGKSRDSESYGSLHSGNRSEDEPFELNEGAVRRGPDGAVPPPAARSKKPVCSRFCVVI